MAATSSFLLSGPSYRFFHQIAAFSTVANVVHSRYGISNSAATREIVQNARIVIAMAVHSATISTNANPGALSPKKSTLQSELRPSWIL